jgi:hypothetical protein
MSKLSKKELARIRQELQEQGIYNVIDAQNQKEYRRIIRGVKVKKKIEQPEIDDDSVLQELSMSPDQVESLISNLSKKKDDTKLEDVDWKNVRNI